MLKEGSLVGGKYTVLQPLAKGGMSQVYLAINKKANKKWVIKELKDKNSLLAETDVLMQLEHPGLPCIVDIVEEAGSSMIVMDYVEGTTLSKLLAKRGKLTEDLIIDIGIQLCDVLIYLHSRKPAVIYRDLKLSNIMLRPDGQIVLIDFGTARWFKEELEEDTVYLGTRGYAAPEQYGGMGQTDERTDIFAFGKTLQQLSKNSSIDPAVKLIIEKCINADPKERYTNVEQIRFDLTHMHVIDRERRLKQRRNIRLRSQLMQAFNGILLIVLVCFFYQYMNLQYFLGGFYFKKILPLFKIIYSLVIDLKSLNF